MKINTKYNVGYEFYVPRVVTIYENHVIQHTEEDGTVNDYHRTVEVLEAKVRHKVVQHIEIKIGKKTDIVYYCINVGKNSTLPTQYREDEMTITNSEIAMNFARRWRDEECCEYYGVSRESFDYDD